MNKQNINVPYIKLYVYSKHNSLSQLHAGFVIACYRLKSSMAICHMNLYLPVACDSLLPRVLSKSVFFHSSLWPPYVIGQAIIFLPRGFQLSFFLLSIFFSWPNLSGRKLDVYHTSTHGVAFVRI